jgi:hypothetical protein
MLASFFGVAVVKTNIVLNRIMMIWRFWLTCSFSSISWRGSDSAR